MTDTQDIYDEGWDAGQAAIWEEAVCSRCGNNHDRDESAMCDDADVISFREWVDGKHEEALS